MQYFLLVTIIYPLQQLVAEAFDNQRIHSLFPVDLAHELLEVVVDVLEDKQQLLVRVNDLFELHNIGMVELLEDRYLANRSARYSFLLAFQSNFLEGDVLILARLAEGLGVFSLVYDSVGALT